MVSLGVIAYQYQTALLRDTANRLLAPYDIEIVDVTGLLLGRSRLAATAIDFRYAGQPHLQSLRQVRISYRPAAIVRGFIDEIHIGEAHLYSDQWPLPLPEALTAAPPPEPSVRTTVDAPAQDRDEALSGELTATLPIGRIAVETIYLEIAAESLSLRVQSQLQLDTFDNGELTLSSSLHNLELAQPHLEIADLTLTGLNARAPQVSLECRGLDNCRVRGEIALTLTGANQPDLMISALSLHSAFDVRYQGGAVTVRTTAPSEVQLGEIESGPHTGAMIKFQLADELYFNYDLGQQLISGSLAKLSGDLPMLRPLTADNLLGVHVDVNSLHASYQLPEDPTAGLVADNLTFNADISISQVYTNMIPYNVWLHRFDQQVRWENSHATLRAQAAVGDITALMFNVDQDWKSGAGAAQVQVPGLAFAADGLNLSHLLSPLPAPGDIVAGEIHAEGEFRWQISPTELAAGRWPESPEELGLTGPLSVSLRNLGGFYMETVFTNLSTDFRAELLPNGVLRGASVTPLTVEGIDAGIAVTNLHANYRIDLESSEIDLSDIRLDLFGGRVSSDSFRYNLQNAAGELVVHIDNIDLSQVLGMSAYDAVSATGLVSGILPIEIRDMVPLVTSGQLRANAPGGTIRYGTGSSGSGNQSLDLVYQALQHYQFELLEADVDYREDGELLLAVRMQGVSPELNQGQRINLNLNISDNIPALLESLQAGRSVTELVERRLGR